MRRVFFTPQIIINRIMTDVVQMISQISTRIVDRSTDHILHIALFVIFIRLLYQIIGLVQLQAKVLFTCL